MKEGEQNQNLNFAISLSAIKGATPKPVKPELLPTPQPETTPPTTSGSIADFRATMQKIDQLSWAIIAKFVARGRFDLAQQFSQGEKRWFDLEVQAIHEGRLDLCDELAFKRLQWLQGVWAKLH